MTLKRTRNIAKRNANLPLQGKGIRTPSLRRQARRGGVKTTAGSSFKAMNTVTECILERILQPTMDCMYCRNVKTISPRDVAFGIQHATGHRVLHADE